MEIEEVNAAIEKELSVAPSAGYTLGHTGMSRGSAQLFGSRDLEGGVPKSVLRIQRTASKTPSKLGGLSEVSTSTLEIELALRKAVAAKVRAFESVSSGSTNCALPCWMVSYSSWPYCAPGGCARKLCTRRLCALRLEGPASRMPGG